MIALVVAALALLSYFGSRQFNPVTGEDQFVSITPNQEIALGLQAAPELIAQFDGEYPDERLQALVDNVGAELVRNGVGADTEWQFDFHLLNDRETLNAFALPGGQIFITIALLEQLETEGQLAAVIGHEIGHVLARHGAQRLAKEELTQGLTGAVFVAASDPDNPGSGQAAAQVAAIAGQLVNMKFGREDEVESDQLGVLIMARTGYDPRAMLQVMQILASNSGGAGPPEFFSTHPNPENRLAEIQQAIDSVYPAGVPEGLTP